MASKIDEWTPSLRCNKLQNTAGSSQWLREQEALTAEKYQVEFDKAKSSAPPRLQGTPPIVVPETIRRPSGNIKSPFSKQEPTRTSDTSFGVIPSPKHSAPSVLPSAVPQLGGRAISGGNPQHRSLTGPHQPTRGAGPSRTADRPLSYSHYEPPAVNYSPHNTYAAWRTVAAPNANFEAQSVTNSHPQKFSETFDEKSSTATHAAEQTTSELQVEDSEETADNLSDSGHRWDGTIDNSAQHPQHTEVEVLPPSGFNTTLVAGPVSTQKFAFSSASVSEVLHSLFAAADCKAQGFVTVNDVVNTLRQVPSHIDALNAEVEALGAVSAEYTLATNNTTPVRNASVRFLKELVSSPDGVTGSTFHMEGTSFKQGSYLGEYGALETESQRSTSTNQPIWTPNGKKAVLAIPPGPSSLPNQHASESARDRWFAMHAKMAIDNDRALSSPYRAAQPAERLYEPGGPQRDTPSQMSRSSTALKGGRQVSPEADLASDFEFQVSNTMTNPSTLRQATLQEFASSPAKSNSRSQRAQARRKLLLHQIAFLNEMLRQLIAADLTALVSDAFISDVIHQKELTNVIPQPSLVAPQSIADPCYEEERDEAEKKTTIPHSPFRTRQAEGVVPNLTRRVPGLVSKPVPQPIPKAVILPRPPTRIDQRTFARVVEGIVFGRNY